MKKTDCKTKITEIENKIPSTTGLVNTTVLITKATEIETKFLILLIRLPNFL